jgi:hypothetical protein
MRVWVDLNETHDSATSSISRPKIEMKVKRFVYGLFQTAIIQL